MVDWVVQEIAVLRVTLLVVSGFQVQVGQVVLVCCALGFSVHVGHMVGLVIGVVGRGVSSTASL